MLATAGAALLVYSEFSARRARSLSLLIILGDVVGEASLVASKEGSLHCIFMSVILIDLVEIIHVVGFQDFLSVVLE